MKRGPLFTSRAALARKVRTFDCRCGAEVKYQARPGSAPDCGKFLEVTIVERACGLECKETEQSLREAITEDYGADDRC
jgi:hypothetical protein